MVLLATVQGAFVSQKFGPAAPGVASLEPEMWATPNNWKAYWLPFTGAIRVSHYHPGIDRAAPHGTPVRAMEQGRVSFAGWSNNIDGNKVQVQINGTTFYQANHLSKVDVKVGRIVQKGQKLGEVGCTGSCTGNHTHEGVSVFEDGRTFLYDPALFQAGGPLENSPKIEPLERLMVLVEPREGINLRHYPIEWDGKGDVFARTRPRGPWGKAGIYRLGTGNRIGPIDKKFPFIKRQTTEGGVFVVVSGFGRRLAVHHSNIKFL